MTKIRLRNFARCFSTFVRSPKVNQLRDLSFQSLFPSAQKEHWNWFPSLETPKSRDYNQILVSPNFYFFIIFFHFFFHSTTMTIIMIMIITIIILIINNDEKCNNDNNTSSDFEHLLPKWLLRNKTEHTLQQSLRNILASRYRRRHHKGRRESRLEEFLMLFTILSSSSSFLIIYQ